ncbi:hypothetical protein KDA_51160 [Dictyobacter alpinus]|uniref:HTH luxR-type domain-containing protein n=1 Tax=Dictyobacter alpinus TaxID=2014873 RepID=A0A402BEB4_9CHLR|nr:helix-turn-helix transcriptional regulator [Dictyobacter alpinus]GCE29632.1 hypothetical protein KDA_51160 [Dictyobacter alpinus]
MSERGEEQLPLLRTKVRIPLLTSRLVTRQRLLAQLEVSRERRLTLVSAPAGAGKTTILVEWLKSVPATCYAWLALDADDNDPACFWRYVLAGLETFVPGLSAVCLPLLQARSNQYFLTVLINTLNDHLAESGTTSILVFEDYHVITEPTLHQAVSFLLEHLQSLHIIISTRADPPLPLARLRGRGHLLELRDADLCFTLQEGRTFLREAMHLSLSPEQDQILLEQTEGWITGLQLAALLVQEQADIDRVLQGLQDSHRYILDYLTDEVLQGQSAEVRKFLFSTSILERFSAPLCDALLQQEDSQERLRQLEQANLFLSPLDEERRWFRYHHLFSGVLRIRLQQAGGEHQSLLHRRASAWYAARCERQEPLPPLTSELEDVVQARYALQVGRPQEALLIIDRLLPDAKAGGRADRVLRMQLLQSLAYHLLENEQEALICFEDLLPLAEREGYLRVFLDAGMLLHGLFIHLAERLMTSPVIRAVQRAWHQGIPATPAPPPQRYTSLGAQALVEPLSEREMEILRLIASGASNQQIADTLIITVNTVKRHISNLLSKLGGSNRTQALVQARKIGLL